MAHTEQEFHVGEEVHIREDVAKMPYGYTDYMKMFRGRNAIITGVEYFELQDSYGYHIDICGGIWHAMCFSKIESTLPEFEGGTVSDFLNMFE